MSLVTRTTTPLGYSISHNALADALLAEYTEDLPDIFTGMKLPQETQAGALLSVWTSNNRNCSL